MCLSCKSYTAAGARRYDWAYISYSSHQGEHPMSSYDDYPRDLIGYGRTPVHPQWPGKARIALQFVLNYEEGAENSVLHGDPASETFLSEMIAAQSFAQRHMSMESLYEYGARAGVWRLLRCLRDRRVPATVFGVGMALERNPL